MASPYDIVFAVNQITAATALMTTNGAANEAKIKAYQCQLTNVITHGVFQWRYKIYVLFTCVWVAPKKFKPKFMEKEISTPYTR